MSTAISSNDVLEQADGLSRLLSIQIAAKRLGVSTFTVRRLIQAKALKSVRISRRVMVPESAIMNAIENGCGR
jgi:excisionase family DNA binding protein